MYFPYLFARIWIAKLNLVDKEFKLLSNFSKRNFSASLSFNFRANECSRNSI